MKKEWWENYNHLTKIKKEIGKWLDFEIRQMNRDAKKLHQYDFPFFFCFRDCLHRDYNLSDFDHQHGTSGETYDPQEYLQFTE